MAFKFFALFMNILVAVNAGHLSGYADYAPTIEKTIQYAAPAEYAAPVTKTIYPSSPLYATKAVYDHEPIQYDNYHAKTIAYPAVGHYGHETVSHHGKVIATPHSYVNKYDTRIIGAEPHYKYAVPAVSAVQTIVRTPVAYPTIVKGPIVPAVKSHYEPEYHHSYAHAAPIIKSHHEPDYHHSYAHAASVIKSAAVSFSPAAVVSHAAFQSANAHYGW